MTKNSKIVILLMLLRFGLVKPVVISLSRKFVRGVLAKFCLQQVPEIQDASEFGFV